MNLACRQFLRPHSISSLTRTVSARYRHHLPMNTVIVFVPQQEAWVVERMGKFRQIFQPGVNFLIPFLDRVKYVQVLKEQAIEIPQQSAVTSDNVTLRIDGVLYLKVVDPYKASYGVEDPEYAITQLAQTTMRSEIGKITLDTVFKERETINIAIVEAISKAASSWGTMCLRYEIRDIKLPERVQEAMQMQVEAERKKRAVVLESEGRREAEINVAKGEKTAKILTSEADKISNINRAQGEANAILAKARARATAYESVNRAIRETGQDAASLYIAEEYVKAFSELAKKSNTLIVPSDTGNVGNMVAQALQIYKHIQSNSGGSYIPEQESYSPKSIEYIDPFDEINSASDTDSDKPPEH